MICLNCSNLTTKPRNPDPKAAKTAKEMAAHGFGSCLRKKPYIYMSPTLVRKCGMFVQAPAESMAARRKWAAK